VDEAVRQYVDAIPSGHRALFDRLHRLILAAHPDAAVVLSYNMGAIPHSTSIAQGCNGDGCRGS
jgi:hypothetical protein